MNFHFVLRLQKLGWKLIIVEFHEQFYEGFA